MGINNGNWLWDFNLRQTLIELAQTITNNNQFTPNIYLSEIGFGILYSYQTLFLLVQLITINQ
jgi:hypothetical protein